MKILIVTPWFHPNYERGGTATATTNFAKGLAAAGAKVTVLTTSNYGNGMYRRSEPFMQNVTVRVVDPTLKRLPRSEAFSIRFAKAFIKIAHEYDIVWVHGVRNLYTLVATILRKVGTIKHLLITPHGSYTENWNKRLGNKFRKRVINSVLERAYVKTADTVHYLSTKEAEDCIFRNIVGSSIIIPNGLFDGEEERTFKHTSRPLKAIIAVRIHPQKNLENLLPAIANFSDEIVLDLYGPVDDQDYFKELKLEQYSNVHYYGFIANQELTEKLYDYDFGILVSIVEGISIFMLEGLQKGLPFIVSKGVGNYTEINSFQAGFVTNNFTSSAIEDELAKVVNIQKFYVLRKNAKKLFENRYEMKKQSEILLQELRKIVS
jgi:glycosyltransferase involved in cell wall biosynthesis